MSIGNCEQTLNNIEQLCSTIANQQGYQTQDMQNLKESVNQNLNAQGQNTADIVEIKQYIENINSMLGIPNN